MKRDTFESVFELIRSSRGFSVEGFALLKYEIAKVCGPALPHLLTVEAHDGFVSPALVADSLIRILSGKSPRDFECWERRSFVGHGFRAEHEWSQRMKVAREIAAGLQPGGEPIMVPDLALASGPCARAKMILDRMSLGLYLPTQFEQAVEEVNRYMSSVR